ncbi:MAG TPA: hypothetical protein VFV40_10510 [Nocardioides sp.]|nr:hypothetical protein [Nocardioides sp.]
MSVDQQIREGLVMLDQKLPTPDTFATYDVLVREARTRTRRSRFLQAGLVAAAAVAVVATGRLGGPGLDPVPPQPADSPSVSATPASGLDGWEDVAGTWATSAEVTTASIAASLEEHGQGDRLAELRQWLPPEFEEGVTLSVEFHLGRADLRYDGQEMDQQQYSVEEDATLYLRPLTAPGGRTRFAARLDGDQLRLVFLDTTVPSSYWASEELRMRALYTTAAFERTAG